MQLNDLLKEFGQQSGLGNLALDENNACRLIFDDKLNVDVEMLPDGERFFIHAFVCAAPDKDDGKLLSELLAANLFGHATGGAVFALDKNQGDILLFKAFETEQTDYQAFSSGLEAFLNSLEYWIDKIASGELGDAEPTEGEPNTQQRPPNEPMIRV